MKVGSSLTNPIRVSPPISLELPARPDRQIEIVDGSAHGTKNFFSPNDQWRRNFATMKAQRTNYGKHSPIKRKPLSMAGTCLNIYL